jgi:hypothetical protein
MRASVVIRAPNRHHVGAMLLIASTLLAAQAVAVAPVAKIAFASCADERMHPGLSTFVAAAAWRPDAAALLGDTPYIDSTEPLVLAERHRAFRIPPWRSCAANARCTRCGTTTTSA